MKRFTKALSMLLTIVMVVGLLPLSIIAEDIQNTHTVEFKLSYNGAHKIPSQKVADGECAVQPEDVTREGWIFEYWYVKTGDGIQKFDLSQPITEDVTLYARWDEDITYWGPIWNRNILNGITESEKEDKPEEDEPEDDNTDTEEGVHTVSFMTLDNGVTNMPESQTVSDGELALFPVIPEKTNEFFVGWYVDKDETDIFNFFIFEETPIYDDITLYALFIDNITDTDGDGVADDIEKHVGSDITLIDTDGDGLTDNEEINIVGTSPVKVDSDDNGIGDFADDYDGDGISNSDELKRGTNPRVADTDDDGLTDSIEIEVTTDPNDYDTDKDGASDGWEYYNDFDPLVFNESFTVEATGEEVSEANPVSASVSLDVSGEQAETLEITPVTYSDNSRISPFIAGYLGHAYDFSIEGEFTEATITFMYDTQLGSLGDEFQPRIYYVDEESDELVELPNQTVTEGKVSVSVTHFSTYILLNRVEFDKVWEYDIKPPEYEAENNVIELVFVIDYSASMDWNDPNGLRKEVSKEFVEKMRDSQDKAAVVSFIKRAYKLCDLTTDKDAINKAIDSIKDDSGYNTYSGTNGSAAIKLALDILNASTTENAVQYIIFLTDGEDTQTSYSYDDLVTIANNNGVTIYSIGLGTADTEIMNKIAEGTGGDYYFADTADSLKEIHNTITKEVIDIRTDTNTDELKDYYTEQLFLGKITDYDHKALFKGIYMGDDPDIDNDGLKNGEEVIITSRGGKPYFVMISNPLVEDTDGDGYNDYYEVTNGYDPQLWSLPRESTKYLATNTNYNYANTALDYYDNYFERVIQGLGSGAWAIDSEEVYRNYIINYFADYADEDYLQTEVIDNIKNSVVENLVESLRDASNTLDDLLLPSKVIESVDILKNTSKVIKYNELYQQVQDLTSRINSVSAAGYTKLAELLDKDLVKISEKLTEIQNSAVVKFHLKLKPISEAHEKYMPENGKLKNVFGGFSVAIKIVGAVDEFKNACEIFAKINANTDAFTKNVDMLEHLKETAYQDAVFNGKSAGMFAASQCIINAIGEGYGSYSLELKKIQEEKISDGAMSVAKELADLIVGGDPYITAIETALSVYDLILGVTDKLEQNCKMLCAYELSNTAIQLFWLRSSYLSYGENSCSLYDKNDCYRYLTHIAQLRIAGEYQYTEYVKLCAVAGWLTQGRNEELNNKRNQKIQEIAYVADGLNIPIDNSIVQDHTK